MSKIQLFSQISLSLQQHVLVIFKGLMVKKRMVLGLVIVTALVQKRWKTMILMVMSMTIMMMMVMKKMVVKMAVGLKKVREVGKVVPARKRSLAM